MPAFLARRAPRATIAILILASLCAAQPAAELSALEARLADPALTTAERDAAADARIELLATLIRTQPDADLAPSRMIDLAHALLSRLARDGADSEALLGIPIGDQARRVMADSVRAASLLNQAADAGARVAARLDRAALDPAAAELLQRLREVELPIRIPLLRGRALLLRAGADPARRSLAADAAADLDRATLDPGPADLWRRANSAIARWRAGALPAEARASLAALSAELASADDGLVDRALWAEVRLAQLASSIAADPAGAADLDRLLAAPPFTLGGATDPLLTVLACDAAARALAELSPPRLDEACRILLSLKSRPLGLAPGPAAALAIDRLGALVAGRPAESIPPVAALARAIALARDPAQRDLAAGLLESIAERPDARHPAAPADAPAAPIAADALWELAILHAETDLPRSARALVRLARSYPLAPRAADAMQIALAAARELASSPAFGPLYFDALSLAARAYPDLPGIDYWRLQFASALLEAGSRDAALDELERIEPAAPSGPAAAALYTATIDTALEQSRDNPPARIALARRAAARAPDAPRKSRYRAELADALTDLQQPEAAAEAAAIYDDLLGTSAQVPGGPPRLRLGLARTHLIAGRAAEGFSALRDLAASIDDSTPAGRDPTYWHAWTLMLETLATHDQAARAGAIRAHIARLASLDPRLGGQPWRSRIERIRRDLGDP